ncbi:MAG: zinc finger domain-containing protein [Candidatus Hydrothermarchaeales archaeon]
MNCISCGAYVVIGAGSVKFSCPECEGVIGRCVRCREQGSRYTCGCGFEGP